MSDQNAMLDDKKVHASRNVLESGLSQTRVDQLLELVSLGEMHMALLLGQEILRTFPNSFFILNVVGVIFSRLGRDEEAIGIFNEAINLSPNFAEAYNNLGNSLKNIGYFAEAERQYKLALGIKNDFAEARNNLGTTLLCMSRFPEAEACFKAALSINPSYAEALNNLASLYCSQGRYAESKSALRECISSAPNWADPHNNLGVVLIECSQFLDAEAAFIKAVELRPDFREARANLGNVQHKLRKFLEARENLDIVLTLEPYDKDALINRWQVLFDTGEYEAALKDAGKIDEPGFRARVLETLFALGRTDELLERMKEFAERDQTNIRSAALVAFVEEREKVNTGYNFCPSPLSFLHFSHLSNHLDDVEILISEAKVELASLDLHWEPSQTTTKGGYQTAKQINLLSKKTEPIKALREIILSEVDAYYSKFKSEECTLIKEWPAEYHLHGWHVVLKSQGYQSAHIHPAGWISGVIYLQVVPSRSRDEGAIEFSLNGRNYFDTCAPKVTHQPENGDIILFPSSLNHRTIPFQSDAERIIVSFDLLPEREPLL